MKKYLLLLISSFVLLLNNASAKIWRVNNTGVPADFTAAQTANNSASVLNGDTLHIEASGATYGTLNLTKQLIIIGNGYLLGTLGSNANPDLQANPATSLLTNITVNTGSNGSVLEGLTLSSTLLVTNGVSNITIRRNRLANVTLGLCSNVQVLQNYIDNVANASINGDGNPATNLQINNNVIANAISQPAISNGDFMNNIIASVNSFGVHNLTNFRVWNNICVNTSTMNMTSCDSRSNIGNGGQFGTLNGNQSSVTMSTVFEDVANTNVNFSEDNRWQLKAGSPAIGVAWNGVSTSGDCGIFGTSATGISYVLSGISNVPTIYKLAAPATVTTNTLNITISTRTNN
jgi:hypothetical protein